MTFIKGFQMYQIILIGSKSTIVVTDFLNYFALIDSK